MTLDPTLLDTVENLWHQQRYRETAAMLKICLDQCDKNQWPDLMKNLRLCLFRDGEFQQLINSLQHQQQSQGLDVDDLRFLSNCHRYLGKYHDAEAITRNIPQSTWRDLDLSWFAHLRDQTQEAFALTEKGRPEFGWSKIQVPEYVPRWHGEFVENLVLLEEAGDGDIIVFARWIAEAQNRCGKIYYAGTSSLAKILHRVYGVEPLQNWNCLDSDLAALAMMSLPHVINSDRRDFGFYLTANQDWRFYYQKLLPKKKPRLGICWSGSVKHHENALRSLKPELLISQLSPLGEILSLQLAAEIPPGVIGTEFVEWEQTLALITTCDAVISVDTSVAHAAAALGVPTLVLTHRACYYTWKPQPPLHRSSWYSQAWNATQPSPGNWDGAVAEVTAQVMSILDKTSDPVNNLTYKSENI